MVSEKKRACDSCHRRKIHCDGALPSCNWCSHHDTVCTFSRPSKVAVRRNKRKTARDVLSERLARVEDTIARARQTLQQTGQPNAVPTRLDSPSTLSDAQGPTATLYSPSPAMAGEQHPMRVRCGIYYVDQLSSYDGIPFCSAEGQRWIEERTGTKPVVEALSTADLPWQPGHHMDPALLDVHSTETTISMEMPDRQLVEKYMSCYYRSKFRLVFPLVDPVLLRRTMDLAYTGGRTLEQLSAKACVFAFLSIVSMLSEEWDMVVETNGDPFILRAQYLLPQVLHDTSVTSLQTVFILCIRHLFSGHLQMSSMFHTMACRILFMLNAHAQPDLGDSADNTLLKFDIDHRTKIHMRNLFWMCYSVDKEISLQTGLPPVIDDATCDLTLPPGYPDTMYSRLDSASESDDIYDLDAMVLPGELRLALFKSKICRMLYSAKAMRKTDAQLLRDIRELDGELEEWRLSVPPPFRPTLSVPQGFSALPTVGLPPHMSMHQIIVHIEYHYLMASIHRASSRCKAWLTKKSDSEMSAFRSSLTLSLEASRSTLRFLRVVAHRLFGGAFWMVMFYAISAILTIFCHVVTDPLDPQSKADMDLIGVAPNLITSFHKPDMEQSEIDKIDVLSTFTRELMRLGNCALDKAQRDMEQDVDSVCSTSNEQESSA